jgi:hypothetical protein
MINRKVISEIRRIKGIMSINESENTSDVIFDSLKDLDPEKEGTVKVKIIDYRDSDEGEHKTLSVDLSDDNDEYSEEMTEDFSSKLRTYALCIISSLGVASCSKVSSDDIEPSKIEKTVDSSKMEKNDESVDFLNTKGKDVALDNIITGLGKFNPKPKSAKSDTVQYKQMTLKPNVKMELPDSAVARNDAPWIGYWKFTDKCRADNQQVMIWAQSEDDPWMSNIYIGYQLPDNDNTYSSAIYKVLADGKKYILSKYSVKYWDWQPNFKNSDPSEDFGGRLTVVVSSPEVDSGENRPLQIDFIDGGKQLKISSWGAGHATRVKGLSDFKW